MCVHLPSLLRDDHLRGMRVELEPQLSVTQVHARLARLSSVGGVNQGGRLRDRELLRWRIHP